ncbi:glycosyltransferase [Nonomuraea sp. NPDC050328]|uniref:glycosyltransferase n=1 Tax=Nonomuraea sp. NPDC050328 TaxID=3364361 RepID=UPI0037AB1D46
MTGHAAVRARGRTVLAVSCTVVVLIAWVVHHLITPYSGELAALWMASLLALVWGLGLALFDRPKTGDPGDLEVAVAVPVFNEDPALLAACLDSLLVQTRPPAVVHVVDDGSTSGTYDEVRAHFLRTAAARGVRAHWTRTANGGKRHAQAVAFRAAPEADIYLTVDSDTVLDRHAIAEGLAPFASPRVMSVAGVCLVANNRRGLSSRIYDLWFVSFQLVDRSGQSAMGAVIVNSGILAFYRAAVVRDNLDGYLNETFFGRPVAFSDDSMLTLYALLRGRTVQQPTCVAFTHAPERMSHRLRQYIRWTRGSTIRTWWRLRYLPLDSYAYWAHLIHTLYFPLATVTAVFLLLIHPVVSRALVVDAVVITVLLSYLQNLRYLTYRRSDQRFTSQLLTYALSPVSTLWVTLFLRPLRWYAAATCFRTGWGTRTAGVEVTLT